MGKQLSESRGKVDSAGISHYAKHGSDFSEPEQSPLVDGEALLADSPLLLETGATTRSKAEH